MWRFEKNPFLPALGAWAALFITAVWAYFPGLAGPFVLDDVLNIATLGDYGGVTDWSTFKAFVFGGNSGPTGRPISLLTFLIDANNWPAEPFPFKRTNLVIHLMNGALVGVLVSLILRLLQFEAKQVRWLALFAAAVWVLHPFLISTTLYAVQRMAQLSTLFVLAGLCLFVYGRMQLRSSPQKSYLIMTIGIGLFTLLATFSKENGILLPMLAGVIEITVVASQRRFGVLSRLWMSAFLLLPVLVVFAYLGVRVSQTGFFTVDPPQNFSVFERLLTEARILMDYLRHWFVPDLYTAGIYQDHFLKSTGWLSPVTTLLSVIVHVAAIGCAILYRRKLPLLSLAVLFFYASHVLESTVLQLELYYEHRNYLATVFLVLPVATVLYQKLDRRAFAITAIVVTIILAGLTRYSATLWSSYPTMLTAAAQKAPTSVRAQTRYATYLFQQAEYQTSLEVIDRAIDVIPGDHADLLVNRLHMLCRLSILDQQEFDKVAPTLSGMPYQPGLFRLYYLFVNGVAKGNCPRLPVESLWPVFAAQLDVPLNQDPNSMPYSQLHYLLGFVAVASGEPVRAVSQFDVTLSVEPRADTALRIAKIFAASNFHEEALEFSGQALQLMGSEGPEGAGIGVSEAEIVTFRNAVQEQIAEPPAADSTDQD
ncbi:MAG: hypothetical protein K0U72_11250 [Gammaproteobacteria bacterium]|nr:hypothetical protein [Gammaproteobacteria bacterium]